MATDQLAAFLRQLRNLAGEPERDASDADLLARFAGQCDETAFEALVRRHGRLVLGVCRRVLRQEQDAEDAFQAAFLVLARKAGSIRRRQALPGWLHQVAFHIALKARRQNQTRQAREREARNMARTQTADAGTPELATMVDEEIQRLPEKYRLPLILCYLQGKTHVQAAKELGCPPGSMSSRLTQARELLRDRLTGRGISLPSTALAAVLADNATAAVPKLLASATVQGAVAFLTDEAAAAGIVSAKALALAKGALKSLFVGKPMLAAAVGLGLATMLGGSGYLALQAPAREAAAPAPNRAAPAPKDAAPAQPAAPEQVKAGVDAFGDPLPARVLARIGTVRFRHGQIAPSLAFSRDGRFLVSASLDATVRVWETATAKEIQRIEDRKHPDGGWMAAFSPDGNTVAAATINGPLRLWDIASGQELRRFERGSKVAGWFYRAMWFSFSPDGKTLAYGAAPLEEAEPEIHLAEVNTGREVARLKGTKGKLHHALFSPDGRLLYSLDDDPAIHVTNIAQGKEIRELGRDPVGLGQFALSGDGKILAAYTGVKNFDKGPGGKTIRIWDAPSGRELQVVHLPLTEDDGFRLALTPDGNTLITSNGGVIRLWDVSSAKEIRQIQGDSRRVHSLALSRDGTMIAAIGLDQIVRVWDAATGKPLSTPTFPKAGLFQVSWSPDGRTVATADLDDQVRLWDSATGRERRRIPHCGPCVYFPDSKRLLSGGWQDGTIRTWDTTTGADLRRFATGLPGVSDLALSQDGKVLAIPRAADKSIEVWDAESGKKIASFAGFAAGAPLRVALSSKGDRLATCEPHAVTVWDVAAKKELRRFGCADKKTVVNLALSADGRFLAMADYDYAVDNSQYDGLIQLYDVARGTSLPPVKTRMKTWLMPAVMAFSPDGKTLATANQEQRKIFLWEVRTGTYRDELEAHTGSIVALAFSPDSCRLASASRDATVLIWDVAAKLTAHGSPRLSPAQLAIRWNDLTAEDEAIAFSAITRLARTPDQALPFIAKYMPPVAAVDGRRLEALVKDLDSARFEVRDRATKDLAEIGAAAEWPLRQAIAANPSLEVRRRAEQLLQRLDGPEKLRQARAVEVLERIGNADARKLLETLANGAPGAALTQDAKESLARLAQRLDSK